MNYTPFSHPSFKQLIAVLFWLLLSIWPAQGQAAKPSNRLGTPEQQTARYFESIRRSPPQMLAFLLRMPKGGDLHNHLSGGIYAESFIQWAADKKLCVNQATLALT
jgi:adenosine deaminase